MNVPVAPPDRRVTRPSPARPPVHHPAAQQPPRVPPLGRALGRARGTAAVPMFSPAAESLDGPTVVVHGALAVLGAAVGTLVAAYSYDLTSSWGLALFVFVMVAYPLGRGSARVLLAPHKLARALYFALRPALATVLLVGALALGGPLTLAAVLGLGLGSVLHGLVAPRLFPVLAAEERAALVAFVGQQAGQVPGDEAVSGA
ncbi:MAG TPA: hypothetical protein VK610_00375 [Rhodothermales bacterium]|nr:hypothetical protein [Rhodothermales bacterium]